MLVKQALALDLTEIYKPAEALGGNSATLSKLINPLIANVLIISGIAALATILLSGFAYISASGDKGKTAQAQLMLNYGIIGLLVIVTAFIITRIIGSIFGFKLI